MTLSLNKKLYGCFSEVKALVIPLKMDSDARNTVTSTAFLQNLYRSGNGNSFALDKSIVVGFV